MLIVGVFMSKIMYLIIFLSVLLIKSETTFGQTIKKDLSVCGKTMSAILETLPKIDPNLTSSIISDEEYCDSGRYEENANFIISFYNAKNEMLYDKHVYLNEHTFSEETDSKGDFKKIKILPSSNSRIIKIPVTKAMGQIDSFSIKSLILNKTYKAKKVDWLKT